MSRPESSAGFSIVVAMDRKRGIGYKGDLPWPKLKGDMRFFRELTTCPDRAAVEKRWGMGTVESADVQKWEDVSDRMKLGVHPFIEPSENGWNAVLMGRKTWQSLPPEYQPLKKRDNYVLSRNPDYQTFRGRAHGWPNLLSALEHASNVIGISQIFVIGGGQVYSTAIQNSSCAHLYITEIDAEFPCDTFFPETPEFQPVLASPWIEENGIRYRFRRYDRGPA